MERIKIHEKFNLSEDDLEKVVGGLDIMPMDYGNNCWVCEDCVGCIPSCTVCTGCTSGCTECTSVCVMNML